MEVFLSGKTFSHVDSLILCQLSYFKFQDLVPDLVRKMEWK